MKFLIKPLTASCAALVLSAVIAPAVQADDAASPLTAAAGVATAYYWRGLQVSNGAQVWGELTYTLDSGFYGDLWSSSEGFGVGPEYDLTAGWTGKFGDLGVNVGAVTYTYSHDSTSAFTDPAGNGPFLLKDRDPGEFSDVCVKRSYGPVFLNAYHNVALLQGQDWINIGATFFDKWTLSVGYQKFEDKAQLALGYDTSKVKKVDYTYADLTYAATKNLSIIVSSIINHNDDLAFFGIAPVADSNRTKVIASYSLPITF
jgi:predicted porin